MKQKVFFFFAGLESNKNSSDYVVEVADARHEKVNITN